MYKIILRNETFASIQSTKYTFIIYIFEIIEFYYLLENLVELVKLANMVEKRNNNTNCVY